MARRRPQKAKPIRRAVVVVIRAACLEKKEAESVLCIHVEGCPSCRGSETILGVGRGRKDGSTWRASEYRLTAPKPAAKKFVYISNEGVVSTKASYCQKTMVCCRQVGERTFVSFRQASRSVEVLAKFAHDRYEETYLEGTEQAFVHAHHRTRIVEFTAVVWCTEQGDELTLGEELISVFHDLMCTADEVHVVFLEEAGYDVRAECEADTSVVLAPSGDVLVGIRPQQIAEQPTVRDLCTLALHWRELKLHFKASYCTHICWSHHTPNLLHGVQVGAEASVHGEDLLVDDSGDGQAVEAVGERLP
jgi:hypothetical protein